jgi:hypothetical protein
MVLYSSEQNSTGTQRRECFILSKQIKESFMEEAPLPIEWSPSRIHIFKNESRVLQNVTLFEARVFSGDRISCCYSGGP